MIKSSEIMQQLNAFSGWLKASADMANTRCEIACMRDDQKEIDCEDALVREYREIISIYDLVKNNIHKMLEVNNENPSQSNT